MKEMCEREPEVVSAVAQQWPLPVELREHLANCLSCEEAERLARLFALSAAGEDPEPLPDPSKIYRMAHLPILQPERPQQWLRILDALAEYAEPVLAGGVAMALAVVVWIWTGGLQVTPEHLARAYESMGQFQFRLEWSATALWSTAAAMIASVLALWPLDGTSAR